MSVDELIDSIIISTKSEVKPIIKQTTLILAIIQLSEKISTEVSIDSLKKYTKVLDYLDNSNKASIISSIMYTATKLASDVESNIEFLQKLVRDSKFLLVFDKSFLDSYNKRIQSLQALKCEFDKLSDEKKRQLSEFENFKAFNTSEPKEERKLQEIEIDNIFDSDNLSKLAISSDSQLTKIQDILTDLDRGVYVYLATAEINGQITEVIVKKNKLFLSYDEINQAKIDKDRLRLKQQAFFMLKLQGSEHVPKTYGIYNTKDESEFTLVMEYCGLDLWKTIHIDWLSKDYKFRLDKLNKAIESLIRGMVSITERNIAHRDLKPHNIFCVDDKFKIGDFDASLKYFRTLRGGTILEESNEVVGTLQFISPELRIYRDKIVYIEEAAKARLNKIKEDLYEARNNVDAKKNSILKKNHIPNLKKIKEGLKIKINPNKSDVFSLGLTLLCILSPSITRFWENQKDIRNNYHYLRMIRQEDDLSRIDQEVIEFLDELIEVKREPFKSSHAGELMAELQKNIDEELNKAFREDHLLNKTIKEFLGSMLKIDPAKRLNFRELQKRLPSQSESFNTFFDIN